MHIPKITDSRERRDIGNPENGVSITKMPRRVSVLERDIFKVYQDVIITTHSPRIWSGLESKYVCNSFGVPEITSS